MTGSLDDGAMPSRIILRLSFGDDASSIVRNRCASILEPAGFINGATGTWETSNPSIGAAMVAVADVIKELQSPATIPGASPNVSVKHVWFYID